MSKIRFASIIMTYRCNAHCQMCNTWMFPSKKEEELSPKDYEKLPFMDTINLTGGEPFLRDDLEEIIKILKKKTRRLVISSNGYLTEKIISLFEKHNDIGIRVSIEGLPKANDELRGLKDGFDKGLRTLIRLKSLGVKDIGFGITISDKNADDLLDLYHLAKMMNIEFATAAIHNSFYFHKVDNKFEFPDKAINEFHKLVAELLRSKRIKDWFRAYFNYGLINYIKGKPRLLPCEMGFDSFFLDPYGEVLACNVMEESMGNIKEKTFYDIWNSKRAYEIREKVKRCPKNCWMIGSVSQQMHKYFSKPLFFIMKHRILKRQVCI